MFMRMIYILWKWLTDKDFKTKVTNAQRLWNQIDSATIGKCDHFYNSKGDKIRGWEPRRYKFPSLAEQETDPLILKYR